MVGISILTLVPGEFGGSETYARGLLDALNRVGELEYRVLQPPAARGVDGGLRPRSPPSISTHAPFRAVCSP